MSVRQWLHVLDHVPAELDPAERMVLLSIAENINDDDPRRMTWPGFGRAQLMHRTGLGEEGLKKVFQRLAGHDLEVRVPMGTDRRGKVLYAVPGKQCRYVLPAAVARPEGGTQVPPSAVEGGTPVPQGGTTGPTVGTAVPAVGPAVPPYSFAPCTPKASKGRGRASAPNGPPPSNPIPNPNGNPAAETGPYVGRCARHRLDVVVSEPCGWCKEARLEHEAAEAERKARSHAERPDVLCPNPDHAHRPYPDGDECPLCVTERRQTAHKILPPLVPNGVPVPAGGMRALLRQHATDPAYVAAFTAAPSTIPAGWDFGSQPPAASHERDKEAIS